MAHWTQQITETYRALQEAELLKGRAAAAKQVELAKQGNPNAVKAILRQEKVGTMTEPKDRNRKTNDGSSYSFHQSLERLALSGFANYPNVTQQKAIDHKKQAQEKKDALQAQDGFRPLESVVREITAELAAAKPKRTAAPMNEVRAVSDNELTTNSGIMKNARNINRVRGVMDRIHNRTQSAGHNAVGTEKDAYDSERGSHMLNALGVKAEVRSSGVGVKVPSQRSPTEAFTAGTNVKMGSNNQSDRAVGALRANNMSSNRTNRPAGPVADTTKKSSVGTTILPGY